MFPHQKKKKKSKVYGFKLILLSRSYLDTLLPLLLSPCNTIDIFAQLKVKAVGRRSLASLIM